MDSQKTVGAYKMSSQKKMIFFVLFLLYLIVGSKCFNIVGYDRTVPISFYLMLSMVILLWTLRKAGFILHLKMQFSIIVFLLFFIPFFSVVLKTILVSWMNVELNVTLAWATSFLFFFMLCYYEISVVSLINFLVVVGLFIFGVQIIQHIFPQYAVFGVFDHYSDLSLSDDYIAVQRNGFFRFRIGAHAFALFGMFFYWSKLLSKFTWKTLLLFLCFFCSMYLYLTRQIMLASAIVLLGSFILSGVKKMSVYKVFLIFFVIVGLIVLWDTLFYSLVEDYSHDSYTTDIRTKCIPFVLDQSMNSFAQFVFGHGGVNPEEAAWAKNGFFLSDVGFFGALYKYGFVWVVVYFVTVFKILKKKYVPDFVKCYVTCTALISVYIFPYRKVSESIVWLAILYISTVYVERKKHGNKVFYCNTCL